MGKVRRKVLVATGSVRGTAYLLWKTDQVTSSKASLGAFFAKK